MFIRLIFTMDYVIYFPCSSSLYSITKRDTKLLYGDVGVLCYIY